MIYIAVALCDSLRVSYTLSGGNKTMLYCHPPFKGRGSCVFYPAALAVDFSLKGINKKKKKKKKGYTLKNSVG